MFRDRKDAALQLASALHEYKDCKPLILAIPRGAVPMAKIIAEALQGDFDVVLVRKLRAPWNPEFAIGSVDESGWTYIADYAVEAGADKTYIEVEKQAQLAVMRERRKQYTPARPTSDPAGRIVIVIDDGLATGATMISALHGLRKSQPQKLICAVPVAPPETLQKIEQLADETVCLEVPAHFSAVGQFYAHFPQVEDEDVVRILRG